MNKFYICQGSNNKCRKTCPHLKPHLSDFFCHTKLEYCSIKGKHFKCIEYQPTVKLPKELFKL